MKWVNGLIDCTQNIIFSGEKKLNCFYIPDTRIALVKKVKEFPLWTNVCVPDPEVRATSSYVESDFGNLKNTLKHRIQLPTTIPIFLRLHLDNIIGGINLFNKKYVKFLDDILNKSLEKSSDNLNTNDSNVVTDDSYLENWGGQGKNPNEKNFDWINKKLNDNDQNDYKIVEPENSSIDNTSNSKNDDVNHLHTNDNFDYFHQENLNGTSLLNNENDQSNIESNNSSMIMEHDYCSQKVSQPIPKQGEKNCLTLAIEKKKEKDS